MAKRIDPNDKRIRKFNNGIGAILCSNCNIIVKHGWLNADVMPLPERITEPDWKSLDPLYCNKCQEKLDKLKK